MENELQIGDVIHGWDLLTHQRGIYTITSVTKTLAKTNGHIVFYRKITHNNSAPSDNYKGEVNMKTITGGSRRYFIFKT